VAEVGATVSIFSDARFRGYSLSGGQPVGTFDFAYDDPSGVYADAAATGVIRRGGEPAPLGFQLSAGYAKRLPSGTSIDFGVTNSTYSHYSNGEPRSSYTEIYAGISRGGLSSRIFLSPHYSEAGLWTAYGEVNGNVSPARNWTLDGHVGMLVPLRVPQYENYRAAFDWRIGVTRDFGRFALHAAWVDGVRGRNYYGNHGHNGTGLVLGGTLIL
jgi:uncharacterized protein (TIGR02001 family)